MGIERMHSPRYWRMRAEEFRAKAEACEFAETGDSLRKIAKTYDEIARRAEMIRSAQDLRAAE